MITTLSSPTSGMQRITSAATTGSFFFFNDTATTKIYTSLHTLSLHDALPISPGAARGTCMKGYLLLPVAGLARSEEHTSELQSRNDISYAVFCLKKKTKK